MASTLVHPSEPKTLIVTNTVDPASMVMRDAVLARQNWIPMQGGTQHGDLPMRAWEHTAGNIWMVCLEDSMIRADNIDEAFKSSHGVSSLTDVIFLSRHAAASGKPSLTCHPIGLPNPTSEPVSGGVPGKCPPPNPRMASCLRELAVATEAAGLNSEFEVTFETTHHGPWLQTPAMFCEIGSTEEHWGRRDAAEVWANVLQNLLRLGSTPPAAAAPTAAAAPAGAAAPAAPAAAAAGAAAAAAASPAAAAAAAAAPRLSDADRRHWCELTAAERAAAPVFISLGGGHYAPKAGDLARKPGVFAGHMLANYAFDWGEGGGWRTAVAEAVAVTRSAMPGCRLAALVDKKAFKAAQKREVESLLEELAVRVEYKREGVITGAAAAAAAEAEGVDDAESRVVEAAAAAT